MNSLRVLIITLLACSFALTGCGGSDKDDSDLPDVKDKNKPAQTDSQDKPAQDKPAQDEPAPTKPTADSGTSPDTRPAKDSERPVVSTGTGSKGENASGNKGNKPVLLSVVQFEQLFASLGNGATVAAGVIPDFNTCASKSGAELGTCITGKIQTTKSALTTHQQVVGKIAKNGDKESGCMKRIQGLNDDLARIITRFDTDARTAIGSGSSNSLEKSARIVSIDWNETVRDYAQGISNQCLTASAAKQVLKKNPALKPFFVA